MAASGRKMATSGSFVATPAARPPRGIAASGTRPTASALATTPARSLQPPDQSLSSQHINHREVGPLQAVAVGPSEAVVLTETSCCSTSHSGLWMLRPDWGCKLDGRCECGLSSAQPSCLSPTMSMKRSFLPTGARDDTARPHRRDCSIPIERPDRRRRLIRAEFVELSRRASSSSIAPAHLLRRSRGRRKTRCQCIAGALLEKLDDPDRARHLPRPRTALLLRWARPGSTSAPCLRRSRFDCGRSGPNSRSRPDVIPTTTGPSAHSRASGTFLGPGTRSPVKSFARLPDRIWSAASRSRS